MNILITGDKSYVGTSLRKWLGNWPAKYHVDSISLYDNKWKKKDFTLYDVVFHVAAVVHKKEKPEMEDLYFNVNKELSIEIAKKAKASGVKQFIFMSSMSVYGLEGKLNEEVVIGKDTLCKPNTYYGKSKLEAEMEISKLYDDKFKVCIIRAPMVYGPGCPGNYTHFKKIVVKIPVFPLTNNKRSMIFIDNLTEFIRIILDNQDHGCFFPQNKEYVNTVEMIRFIAKENGKQIYLSKVLSLGIALWGKRVKLVNKVFGNLVYELSLSNYKDFEYCIVGFKESITACEKEMDNHQ